MTIATVARKLLWGRAGNRCAWLGCQQRLTVDLQDPESAVLGEHGAVLGEEAHIRSSKADGPRYDPDYPVASVDSYGNLLLLCPTHHALIDKDHGAAWSTRQLLGVKARHEALIDASLTADERHERELAERLVARIVLWESKLAIDNWQSLTWLLNSPHPSLNSAWWRALHETSSWLLALDWPTGKPRTAAAFENHRRVLLLVVNHLADTVELENGEYVLTRGHKHLRQFDEVAYTRLISKFGVESNMLWLLVLELTRSVNLVVSAVRLEIDPLYRFDQGLVLATDGDLMSGQALTRLEYRDLNWNDVPFDYSLNDLRARMEKALGGGDPRRPDGLNLYEIELVKWLEGM